MTIWTAALTSAAQASPVSPTVIRDSLSFWISIAGAGVSFFGLCVGLYTLLRVKRVADTQREERQLTEQLLGIDQLELDLERAIEKLFQDRGDDSVSLARDLTRKLGALQGVRKAIDSPNKSDPKAHVKLEKGFFDQDFLISHIRRAKRNIDIITGRLKIVYGFAVMDELRKKCESHVKVRVVGMGDDADAAILEDARKTVANPAPLDAEDYRQQILQGKNEILRAVREWKKDAQECFAFSTNRCVPRVTFVRIDDIVCMGFLQFFAEAQPSDLKDREFIEMQVASGVGQVTVKHFDIALSTGSPVWPPEEPATPSVKAPLPA